MPRGTLPPCSLRHISTALWLPVLDIYLLLGKPSCPPCVRGRYLKQDIIHCQAKYKYPTGPQAQHDVRLFIAIAALQGSSFIPTVFCPSSWITFSTSLAPTTSIMSYRPVIVDQRLGSSPASSGRTTPSVNSLSPSPSPSYSSSSSYRQYGARKLPLLS